MSGRITPPGGGAFAARFLAVANAMNPACTRAAASLSQGEPPRGGGREHAPAGPGCRKSPPQVDITFRYVKVGHRPTRRREWFRARSDKRAYRIACKRRDHARHANASERGRDSCRDEALPGRRKPRAAPSGAWGGRSTKQAASRLTLGGRG